MNATCNACGRVATHTVSNGAVTIRVCYIHAHKIALQMKGN